MVGPYVRLERIALFVNLGMLKLSYPFQTLQCDFLVARDELESIATL